MITSMTGFASLTREDELATIGVTVRSVNHRYLDVQVRAPQALAAFEQEVRSRVQRRVARGRVELTVTLAAKALRSTSRSTPRWWPRWFRRPSARRWRVRWEAGGRPASCCASRRW